MKNTLCVIALLIILLTGNMTYSQVPEICRVQGGNTKTIWGTGFQSGLTEVYVADITFDETKALAALETESYKGKELLPAVPPEGAKKLNILSSDPRGLIMAVEFSDVYNADGFYGDGIGGQVVWVKNRDGFSKPWLVHSTNSWFVYPEKTRAGEKVRVFGRNINPRIVCIRKIGETKVQSVRFGGLVHNRMYETEVSIPKDILPGDYEVFIHNGSGGAAGWSVPLKLIVGSNVQTRNKYYEAGNYGIKGDGYSDDTKSLQFALDEIAKAGGGVLVLHSGSFIVSKTIEIPEGVSIKGAGKGATTLQVLEDNPMSGEFPEAAKLEGYANDWLKIFKGNGYAPMLWLRNKSSISDLSIVYGPGVGFGILIARCPGLAEDIRIERTNILANHQSEGWQCSVPVLVAGNTYGLVVADNDFKGWGAIEVISNNHSQAYIGRNHCVSLPTGISNEIFTRGFNKSVIESNEVSFGLRNYSSQNGRKFSINENIPGKLNPDVSTVHLAMIGNVYSSNVPRRHNDGEMMIESGVSSWRGKVWKANKNYLTVNGEPFDADLNGCYILVLDGKGIGQYRKIESNTKSKLVFEKVWDVVPDETTFITIGGYNVEHLWIDNTLDHNASWSGFWGNNVGHVVDGQIMRDGGSFNLWAHDSQNPATVAFIDLIGIRTIGGGGIRLLGSPVFGNTIRHCEIIDFKYYPTFHIIPGWLQENNEFDNIDKRYGINFHYPLKFEDIPATAPLRGWNIIEGNNIYDGPKGINIPEDASYTIIKQNSIQVDKDQIVNSSKTTTIK